MSITDKTRKTLWARSGNRYRCAMCRVELVSERDGFDKNLNLGEECHIISSKENGPRHVTNLKDYDELDNLILLCRNHHRTIDEQFQTYSASILYSLKESYEKWVKTVLDSANTKSKEQAPTVLRRITTGKELLDVVLDVSLYQFDHIPLDNQEEVDAVGIFFEDLQDWNDLYTMGTFESSANTQKSFDLNDSIRRIESLGLWIFGERKKQRMMDSTNKKDLGLYDLAILYVTRENDQTIMKVQVNQ